MLRFAVRAQQSLWRYSAALRPTARSRSRNWGFHNSCGSRGGGRGVRSRLSRREPHAHALSARSRESQPLLSIRSAISRSDPDRRLRHEPATRFRDGIGVDVACGRGGGGVKRPARRLSGGLANQEGGAGGAPLGLYPGRRCETSGADRRRLSRLRYGGRRGFASFRGVPGDCSWRIRRELARLAQAAARWRRGGHRSRHRQEPAQVRLRGFCSVDRRPPTRTRSRPGATWKAFDRLLPRSRGGRRARWVGGLGARWRALPRRFHRGAARSVFGPRPELELACAEPDRRRASGLERIERDLRRQHAARGPAADRPCDGPAATFCHSRGG